MLHLYKYFVISHKSLGILKVYFLLNILGSYKEKEDESRKCETKIYQIIFYMILNFRFFKLCKRNQIFCTILIDIF